VHIIARSRTAPASIDSTISSYSLSISIGAQPDSPRSHTFGWHHVAIDLRRSRITLDKEKKKKKKWTRTRTKRKGIRIMNQLRTLHSYSHYDNHCHLSHHT